MLSLGRVSFALALLAGLPAMAGTITTTVGIPLGGVWVDGYVLPDPGVGAFIAQVDTSPFNQYIGGDFDLVSDGGGDFSGTWTFNFNAAPLSGATVTGVSLLIAIFDHDSSAAGNQVKALSVNGVDATSQANTQFEGHGGTDFEYNLYSIALPSGVFSTLGGGTAVVQLDLQGPGQVLFFGDTQATPTAFNGAGVDYSTLNIDYQDQGQVPEPSTMLLAAGGLLAVAALKRRATP
jgi:hypothetical protein